jgi:tRNA(Ile2) C34 agmatinyltransferase TiaS
MIQRAQNSRYHIGETNHCPGCGRSQWSVGRITAECAFCSTALPLADSSSRTPRLIGFGKGGGKTSRMMAAA